MSIGRWPRAKRRSPSTTSTNRSQAATVCRTKYVRGGAGRRKAANSPTATTATRTAISAKPRTRWMATRTAVISANSKRRHCADADTGGTCLSGSSPVEALRVAMVVQARSGVYPDMAGRQRPADADIQPRVPGSKFLLQQPVAHHQAEVRAAHPRLSKEGVQRHVGAECL